MAYTWTELKKESASTFQKWIVELEIKLKYTKKTVKRNEIIKEIMFWEAELDETEEKVKKFFERYPLWTPKG
jgi:ethanolamine utilization cobalamin adenosyltransferase